MARGYKHTKKRQSKELSVRFWPRVAKSDGCWEWQGRRSRWGYGQVYIGGGAPEMAAHRVAWQLVNGPIPDSLYVLHRCDNRRCVRPDHLFLGTHMDNMNDRGEKRRTQHGERHVRAKLSAEQAVDVFRRARRGDVHATIAAEFGITRSVVSRIASGLSWRIETEGL